MPVQQGSGHRSYLAGFDYADATAFGAVTLSGGVVAVQQAIKRSGAGALRTSATANNRARLAMTTIPSGGVRQFNRAYLYVVAYPTVPRLILVAGPSPQTTVPQLQLNTNGTLSLQMGSSSGGGGTLYATTPAPIPLATWVCVELGLNSQDNRAALRLDGVDVGGWITLPDFGATLALTLGPMETVANSALDLYWDDIAVDLEDWCGPGRVERVRFVSARQTGGTATLNNAASIVAAVDKDTVLLNTAEASQPYVQMSAFDHRIFLTPGTFPTGVLRGIMVRGVGWQVTVASVFGTAVALDAVPQIAQGSGAAANVYPLAGPNPVWNLLRQPLSTAVTQTGRNATPVGGLWTDARIRRAEIGFSQDSSQTLRVGFFALEVDNDDESDLGPPATRTLIEGFETGRKANTDSVSGQTALQSSLVRSGAYALRIGPTTSESYFIFSSRPNIGSNVEAFIRAYVRIASYPASGSVPLLCLSGLAGVWVYADGSLRIRNPSSSHATAANYSTQTASGVLALNTWHCLEMRILRSNNTTDGTDYEVRVDGVQKILSTNQAQSIIGATGIVIGGMNAGATAYDFYFDDLAIDATDWCGPGMVGALTPNASFNSIGVAGDSGPTTGLALYTMVDEIPPDDDTTYFNLGLTSNVGIYYQAGFSDPDAAAVVVRGVSVMEEAKSTGAASSGTFRRLVVHGEVDLANLSTSVGLTTYRSYQSLGQISPFRGAWTPALLAALDYRLQPNSVSNNARFTQLLVQYEYDIESEFAVPLTMAMPLSLDGAFDLSVSLALADALAITLDALTALTAQMAMSAPLDVVLPLTILTAASLTLDTDLIAALSLATSVSADLGITAPLSLVFDLDPSLLVALGISSPLVVGLDAVAALSALVALAAPLDVSLMLVVTGEGTPLSRPSSFLMVGLVYHGRELEGQPRPVLVGLPRVSMLKGMKQS